MQSQFGSHRLDQLTHGPVYGIQHKEKPGHFKQKPEYLDLSTTEDPATTPGAQSMLTQIKS